MQIESKCWILILQSCAVLKSDDTIWYDTVDVRALKNWRDGQLNLAHGPVTKNNDKIKIKIKNRVAQTKRCRTSLLCIKQCIVPTGRNTTGVAYKMLIQAVALMGRITTGPLSRAAPWWVTLHMRRCYRRRQTPVTVTSLAHLHCV